MLTGVPVRIRSPADARAGMDGDGAGSTFAAKPIAGTTCSEFPKGNYWHADVSVLPVHARSQQWLSHMSTGNDLHPDFGPSYGDGPDYGIPITVVGGGHPTSGCRSSTPTRATG